MPHSTCLVCLYRHCSTHTLPRPAPLESWSLSLLPGFLPVVSLPSWLQTSCPSHPWLSATYTFFSSSRVTYIRLLPVIWIKKVLFFKQVSFPSLTLPLYGSNLLCFLSQLFFSLHINRCTFFFLSCHSPAWAGTWSSPALGIGFTRSVTLVLEPLEGTRITPLIFLGL